VRQQIHGSLAHPPAEARRTEPAAAARERHEQGPLTVLALQVRETAVECPASDVALEVGAHEGGQGCTLEAMLHGRVERAQVLAHETMQGLLFRAPTGIGMPGRRSCVCRRLHDREVLGNRVTEVACLAIEAGDYGLPSMTHSPSLAAWPHSRRLRGLP
jgi:hypothetical protein